MMVLISIDNSDPGPAMIACWSKSIFEVSLDFQPVACGELVGLCRVASRRDLLQKLLPMWVEVFRFTADSGWAGILFGSGERFI